MLRYRDDTRRSDSANRTGLRNISFAYIGWHVLKDSGGANEIERVIFKTVQLGGVFQYVFAGSAETIVAARFDNHGGRDKTP